MINSINFQVPIIWFIANCGGILGLCMGFSLITIFEIVNYSLQIVCNKIKVKLEMVCTKYRQEEHQQSTKDIELVNEVADEDKDKTKSILNMRLDANHS